MCAALDEKFTDKISVHDARFDSEHQHFETVCVNLDHKWTEKSNAQDEHVESLRVRIVDGLSQLDQQFSTKTTAMDGRMDALAESIEKSRQMLSDQNADLDKRLAAKNAEQDQHLSDLRVRRCLFLVSYGCHSKERIFNSI
eukprot:SAG31_NODE_997_length_10464_cov_16.740473_2_plen_141_part_00